MRPAGGYSREAISGGWQVFDQPASCMKGKGGAEEAMYHPAGFSGSI